VHNPEVPITIVLSFKMVELMYDTGRVETKDIGCEEFVGKK
jgi:hypothetical protein